MIFKYIIKIFLLIISTAHVLSDSFGHWFDDQSAEITDNPYKIKFNFYNGANKLPESLLSKGSLIRLGPTILNTPIANYTNYVDGFGRISKWTFGDNDQVLFQSSIIKSTLWNNSDSGSSIPPHITSEKLNPSGPKIIKLDNMDNTDVFPYQFPSQKDKIIVSTDFFLTNQIHLDSLRTLGSTKFNDESEGTFSSSHSVEYTDSTSGKIYRINWLGQKDATGTKIYFYKMGDDYKRQVVGSYHIGYLPYSVHQVMVVGDYGIMYISPVKLDFLKTGANGCISCSIDDNLDKENSIWLVFDLKSTVSENKPVAVINTPKDSNFFVFHYANGKFSDGSNQRQIALDTCAYNTMDGVLGEYVLGNLKDILSPDVRNSMPYFCDSLRRVTLDLDKQTILSRTDFPLQDSAGNKYRVELLSINNDYIGKDYCIIYGLSFHAQGSALYEDMAVLKINICKANSVVSGSLPSNTPTVELFSRKNLYLGEPIFVPSPSKTSEDDGHLLIVARDGDSTQTKLLVIEAKTMTLIADAVSPFPLMFEFHGAYFPGN